MFFGTFGKLLYLAKYVLIDLLKPALVIYDLPKLELFHLFHNTLNQRITILFIHGTKFLSDSFSAIMKLPFDRPLGDTHTVCNLRDRKIFKIMQEDDLLDLFRQHFNAFVHFVSLFGQCIHLCEALRTVIREMQVVHNVQGDIASVSVDHIQCAVFGNTAHP